MTGDILNKMLQRKKAQNTPEYKLIDKEIRILCRADKDTWYQTKCKDLEDLEIKSIQKRNDKHEESYNRKQLCCK